MGQPDFETLRTWPLENVSVIDTETTGLDDTKDEVLSLTITDGNGNVLFDRLIKPRKRKRWDQAAQIHGIRWSDVKDEKELVEYEDELKPLLDNGRLIVGYNTFFDVEMLRASGAVFPANNNFDVMQEFAKVHGKWSDWKQDRQWVKLKECASFYHYPKFDAHSSSNDAVATAYCFRELLNDPEYISYRKKEELAQQQRAQQLETQRAEAEKLAQSHAMSKYIVWIIVTFFLPFIGAWFLVKPDVPMGPKVFAIIWCILFAIGAFGADIPIFTSFLFAILSVLPLLYWWYQIAKKDGI